MKRYNLLKVLFISIVIATVLASVIPGSYVDYSGNVTESAVNGVGLFGMFSNVNITLTYFSNIALLLVAIAIFYSVLKEVPAYNNFALNTSKKFENKKGLLVILTSVIFGILALVSNNYLLLLVFVPFVIDVMEKLELDKKVILSSTIVAGIIGSMCSIYNNTLFSYFELKITTLLIVKLVVFVLSLFVLIIFIAPKNNKKIKKESKAKEEKKLNKKEVKEEVKKESTKKTVKNDSKKSPSKPQAKKTAAKKKTTAKGKKVA